MKILDQRQIRQKVKRLSFEILENNYGEPELILAGINRNGLTFARRLMDQLREITSIRLTLTRLRLNPANPLEGAITLDIPVESVRGKVIIVVDDVANTGRTIFYACKPLLETLPKKIEVAVLVDRKHKSFPVRVDYVGLALATTLMENIDVQIDESEEQAVYLN